MAYLIIHELDYRWHKKLVLPRISFSIAKGAFACLLGPSGCGKTTLLRLLAGLELPESGDVRLDGEVLTNVSPDQRAIGMVFQQPTLFPTKTVRQNILFGIRKKDREIQETRLRQLLETIGLGDRADAYPHELSGGQQHRVALARALAPSPKLLLLDEPFAHLDPERRQRLRKETLMLTKQEEVTCLMVTHDAGEAMQMGDSIILMDASGHIRQQGTPHDVYHQPVDRYAALALGEMNLLAGQSDGRVVKSVLGDFESASNICGEVLLGLRPQDCQVSDVGQGVKGTIEAVLCTGPEDFLNIRLQSGEQVQSRLAHTHHWRTGDEVGVKPTAEHLHVFAMDA